MDSQLIASSLDKSVSYLEYRSIINDLLDKGLSTGVTQSEDLLHYSKLNQTRMNRLDKTLTVAEDVLEQLSKIEKRYIFLTLSEGWCGDAAQIVPVLNAFANATQAVDLRIVFRDENEELMNEFLTNGGKSIPKVIIIDAATNEVVTSWGPRPKAAHDLVIKYKKEFGVIDETLKINLQKWYLEDKGFSTQHELLALLK